MTGHAHLRIVIAPDGSAKVQVSGVTGPECRNYGGDVAAVLGTIVSDDKTTEYYAQPQSVTREQRRMVVP